MKKTKEEDTEVSPELSDVEIEQVQDIQEQWQTQPVPEPDDPHSVFDYDWNGLKRCHLCGNRSDHMKHTAPGVWFMSNEDLAKHVIEVHRNFPWEVVKAREILGMNVYAPLEETKPVPPVIPQSKVPSLPLPKNPYPEYFDLVEPVETESQQESKPKPKSKSPISLRKLLMIAGAILIIYLIYVGYLMTLGYTF